MAVWQWVALGAVIIVGMLFSVRLMRRGLTTMDADHARHMERIRRTEEELENERRSLTSGEHLRLARAALEDLLRLAGNPPGASVEPLAEGGHAALELRLPGRSLRVGLTVRECELAHGALARRRSTWHLRGPGLHEDFADLAPLMGVLSAQLAQALAGGGVAVHPLEDADAEIPPEPPHLARRLAGMAAVRAAAQRAPQPRHAARWHEIKKP